MSIGDFTTPDGITKKQTAVYDTLQSTNLAVFQLLATLKGSSEQEILIAWYIDSTGNAATSDGITDEKLYAVKKVLAINNNSVLAVLFNDIENPNNVIYRLLSTQGKNTETLKQRISSSQLAIEYKQRVQALLAGVNRQCPPLTAKIPAPYHLQHAQQASEASHHEDNGRPYKRQRLSTP